MKRHHKVIVNTAVIIGILAVSYFILLYKMIYLSAKPVDAVGNLTVVRLDKDIVMDNQADFWESVPPTKIHLYPQAARAPYGTKERDIFVRAVYNDHQVAFLLEFEDNTQSLGAPENPDACAVLIAGGDAPATAQMMGYESHANVWQWLADRNVERFVKGNESVKPVRELVASGPGTQTQLTNQNVDGRGAWNNGKWSVMFKRSLESNQEGEIQLQPGTDMNVAFALWDGSRAESFSRKSIAILRPLKWEL